MPNLQQPCGAYTDATIIPFPSRPPVEDPEPGPAAAPAVGLEAVAA